MSIAFIDLAAQQKRIKPRIDAAIAKVLAHGAYVMGPEVREFEAQMAAFAGAKHALSCANGTEALVLPLMAWGVGPGDAVFCPSFTFAATGEVIPWIGASPVFVDILPDTYNMDPDALEGAIQAIKAAEMVRAFGRLWRPRLRRGRGQRLWPFKHSRQPYEFWWSIRRGTFRWLAVRFF